MKKLFCIIVLLLFNGCFFFESDDPEDDGRYKYSFKNQVAQGKIAGSNWMFIAGRGKTSGDELLIELFEVSPQVDTCSYNGFSNSKCGVTFYVSKTPGVYELGFSKQVSFTGNKITSLGAIELIKLDTVASVITGRVDGYFDEKYNVNGTFTVKFCR
jgi:hypothetical protein